MYKTSDTPNSGTLPSDALIEIELADGSTAYILGSVIHSAISSGAPDSDTSTKGLIETATTAEAAAGSDSSRATTPEGVKVARRYTIVDRSSTTSINVSYGVKPYFRCTGSWTLTLPTPTSAGFSEGDEVVLYSTDGNQTISASGTVNKPASFALSFAEAGAMITLIARSSTEWDAVGDFGVS